MAESEFVKKWLQKADEDFEYAVSSLREELNFFPQICWHFQQAAEKYLKAYIVAFDLEFKKIHDLTALLKICENKNSDFCSLLEACTYLQRFYIETRYPVAWECSYSIREARQAQDKTQKIIEFVKNNLPIEV